MRLGTVLASLALGLILGCLLLLGYHWALSGRNGSTSVTNREGSLTELIDGFVRSIPPPSANAYDVPTPDEAAAIADAFTDLEQGDLPAAAERAASENYTVTRLTDPDGSVYDVLAPGSGATDLGWGMFVHADHSRSPVLVEVAHPRDDRFTGQIGVRVFLAGGARDLLVAGADRDAGDEGVADVAHAPGTVFGAVGDAIVHPRDTVVQPHGFDRSDHPVDGQAVVSSGRPRPGPPADVIAAALRRVGYTVCLFKGEQCADLAGTTNLEGQAARDAGAHFVQVELAHGLRADPAQRRRVSRVLAAALDRIR